MTVLVIPLPPSANRSFRANHMAEARRKRDYTRKVLEALAGQEFRPAVAGETTVLLLELVPHNRLGLDVDNRMKFLLDALVSAGVAVDDGPDYLRWRAAQSFDGDRGTVRVTTLAPEPWSQERLDQLEQEFQRWRKSRMKDSSLVGPLCRGGRVVLERRFDRPAPALRRAKMLGVATEELDGGVVRFHLDASR